MTHLRKFLLALVAGALLLTTMASAQPYSCNAAAVPTLVRSEGIAELMGDFLLMCSGTAPPAGIQANVRIALNTNITSNVLASGPPVVTEALLVLDEGAQGWNGNGAPAGTQTLYQGIKISDTELEFQDVILSAPPITYSTIRITNVRGNASALGTTATIFARINITGPTTVPVNNPQLVVADTRKGMEFSVTAGSFKNCESPGNWSVKFKEGFSSAFRPVGDADVNNTTPGGAFLNESGFHPPTPLDAGSLTGLTTIGQANQGTRLMARLSDVPSGVTLSVYQRIVVGGLTLQLVSSPNSDGSGGTLTTGGTSDTATVTDLIVYEVTGATLGSIATQETVTVIVMPSYTVPGPLGTAKVNGNFAPVSTVFTMDSTAPEPRFADVAVDQTAFSIDSCETDLIGLVQSLGSPAGPLNSGQVNSLVKKLEHVLGKLDRTQTKTACNELRAFVNQVSAFVAGGVLAEAQGNELISQAQQMGNTVPCDF